MQIVYLCCSLSLLDLDSVLPGSSKIEILAKIANGFDTLSRLLFLQKAQSELLAGFLNLPFLMNRLQHKNHCIF